MLEHTQSLRDLMRQFPRAGRVEWIGVRPQKGAPLASLASTLVLEGRGLDGDHRAERRGGNRQVTLVQAEHLSAIAALVARPRIEPGWLRRNLLVSGINLLALKGQRVRVGEALLEVKGPCHPCSRMEQILGVGGYNAMRGHGGVTAVVLESGRLRSGDAVSVATT